MDRRAFMSATLAAAASSILPTAIQARPIVKAQNVVLYTVLLPTGRVGRTSWGG
jgi:hypothetical protein